MDTVLLGELVKRGLSMSRGSADAAGYSILAHDRLSLDNLVAKIRDNQTDIRSAAVVDHKGIILAHSDMQLVGENFLPVVGKEINKNADGSLVSMVARAGSVSYEFSTPIMFANNNIGSFHLAIDGEVLATAQQAARRKVAFMSAVIIMLSVAGVFFIARIFTTPIKRLTNSVSLLKTGSYQGNIEVTLRDELGGLTRNFNEMAQVILSQRDKLQEYAQGLQESYLSTVKILATSIDARDDYTLQHSTRVAALCLLIGEELGLSSDELRELEVAALVHDLGKIRIPDHVLKKAGALDKNEWQMLKQHPRDGAEILDHSRAFHKFIPAVLYHHEWHNGQGYPDGLKGDDIPLFASIIAIADAYDAMTTSRPYNEGRTADTAILEILRCRGSQFNPLLVDLFVGSLAKMNNNRFCTMLETTA